MRRELQRHSRRPALRIAEALSLLPKDIDLDAGTIRVLHGKGDRSRTVGIDADAATGRDRALEAVAVAGRRDDALLAPAEDLARELTRRPQAVTPLTK